MTCVEMKAILILWHDAGRTTAPAPTASATATAATAASTTHIAQALFEYKRSFVKAQRYALIEAPREVQDGTCVLLGFMSSGRAVERRAVRRASVRRRSLSPSLSVLFSSMMNFVYQKEAGCDLCYLDFRAPLVHCTLPSHPAYALCANRTYHTRLVSAKM